MSMSGRQERPATGGGEIHIPLIASATPIPIGTTTPAPPPPLRWKLEFAAQVSLEVVVRRFVLLPDTSPNRQPNKASLVEGGFEHDPIHVPSQDHYRHLLRFIEKRMLWPVQLSGFGEANLRITSFKYDAACMELLDLMVELVSVKLET